jgi:hypothetical protein
MPLPEGNRPHNLDVSTLKALPKQREPGWSIKKPAEQQARERLSKPPPERPRQVYASGTLEGLLTFEEIRQFLQLETKEDSQ